MKDRISILENAAIQNSTPEFHPGIRAYYSAWRCGLKGICNIVTVNGRTIGLPI